MKNKELCTNEQFIVRLGRYIHSVPCLDYIKDNQLTTVGTFTLIAVSINYFYSFVEWLGRYYNEK